MDKETQDLYNEITDPTKLEVALQALIQRHYKPTDGVSMVSVFSSTKPVHDVMYFLAQNNIPFRICLGSYKGVVETSFCIPTMMMPIINEAKWILDGQESVMHVRSVQGTLENHVEFEYLRLENQLRFQYQGKLALASKADALAADGYTYDPSGLTYSVIVN